MAKQPKFSGTSFNFGANVKPKGGKGKKTRAKGARGGKGGGS
jgi:hypothetical protein